MNLLALDTWAFLETISEGPRASEVFQALKGAEAVVTSREVLVETFNAISRRNKSTDVAWNWFRAVRATKLRILEFPLEAMERYIESDRRSGGLSFTDYSLAMAAQSVKTREIATEDAEFRRLGLNPLFARRPA